MLKHKEKFRSFSLIFKECFYHFLIVSFIRFHLVKLSAPAEMAISPLSLKSDYFPCYSLAF